MIDNIKVTISTNDSIEEKEVLDLYHSNKWSAANKPEQLINALRNSHSLVTARISGKLVGIGNAISDGHLVVYYPHMLVDPLYQGQNIGRNMMEAMKLIYNDFHQQILVADSDATNFYKALGFERAGKTESMWIYEGGEH